MTRFKFFNFPVILGIYKSIKIFFLDLYLNNIKSPKNKNHFSIFSFSFFEISELGP